MNGDRIKQPDENIASSSKKRAASLPDFAAGKTNKGILENPKKKVRFNENHEEGHPISKYRDRQDVKILDKRDEIDILNENQKDIKSLDEDIRSAYHDLKKKMGKVNIKGSILFTIKDCNKILKSCEEIYNKYRDGHQTRNSIKKINKVLSKKINKLTSMLIALHEVEANLPPSSDS